ncbi:MAG TPA: threonine--tRNA ligase [Bacilli bacterium]|nr:threonine--tRNA ligase [Bacilli bacterium]
MINIKEDKQLNIMNHSCAHLLAQAVKHLYPHALFWVGPVIEEGFYYDIDLGDDAIKEEDLEKIEKEMKKISKDGKRIYKEELTRDEALEKFKSDPYKIDLINHMDDNTQITCYTQGDFTDLCRGPHVDTVKELKYFKLLKVSGAYWKADSNNKMLQRIYGVCFKNEKDLEEHLQFLEEAKKRDHRKLGKEMELFMISEYGPGFPFFLPKGMVVKQELENFWCKVHLRDNYKLIQTPTMLNQQLWEVSGHWYNYKENMYTCEIDDKAFAIKPMNCPGGMLVYKNDIHSYKEFPLRIGELGHVHRHEASGALSGLFRVRAFTQDDAHIFMTEDQIESEISHLIDLYDYMYSIFGLSYHIELSTRPEDKYIGEIATWDKAELALKNALENKKINYILNPGDGAFYGPKLDFKLRDSLNRIWQCGTIQLDMNLPERFDLTYIDKDGSKKRPVMVHRALYGSFERFIGILIEHFAGAFPLWIAPVQVNIIPVNNIHHLEYAKEVKDKLFDLNIRVELDDREEKLGYKMRDSQMKKIPYSVIIGDKEKDSNLISFRKYGEESTTTVTYDEFIKMLQDKIESKDLKY